MRRISRTLTNLFVAGGCVWLLAMVVTVSAQQPPAPGQTPPAAPPAAPGGRAGGGAAPAGGGGRGGGAAYPAKVTDPAAVARGRGLYQVNGCQFCHGADIRGGDTGPSLLRSQLVQRDQKGETIAEVVLNGRPNTPMVAFKLTQDQIADIAEFLHSFTINSRDPARMAPASILTGAAPAGQTYFTSKCASCHSVTGDLRGIATKYAEPRTLQQAWLAPGGGGGGRGAAPAAPAPGAAPARVTTVSVTVVGKPPVEGRLVRIDDFLVTLALADGTQKTFARRGDVPKVEVKDPLAAHKALYPVLTDKDIHDVTAYLNTIK